MPSAFRPAILRLRASPTSVYSEGSSYKPIEICGSSSMIPQVVVGKSPENNISNAFSSRQRFQELSILATVEITVNCGIIDLHFRIELARALTSAIDSFSIPPKRYA